jgi:formylglycine-generating enzyme required for sulfatase activity
MNNHFLFRISLALSWAGVTAVLLLGACNLPGGTQAIPTLPYELLPPPVATGTLTPEPASTLKLGGLVSGTPLQWMDGSVFIFVPPDEFTMGADRPQGGDFTPAHTVSLTGFWIQQSEVTNRMYALCVAAGNCDLPFRETGTPYWYADRSRADYPVVGLDWENAQTYCKWIEAVLPTEAQWEMTARGTLGDPYPWGEADPTCDLLNFKDCLTPSRLARVRSYPLGASPYTAADMAGNVFEWVNDWYGKDYYMLSPAADPPGPANGTLRLTRSSSFRSLVDELKVVLRWPQKPTLHRADLGFRCVLTGEAVDHPFALPCTTTSYLSMPTIPDTPVQPTPFTPYLTGAFCQDLGGTEIGVANIELGEPYEPYGYEVSSPDGDISCSAVPASNRMSCTGTALRPGSTATVTICPTISSVPFGEPGCPVGYAFSNEDNLCHFNLEMAAAGPEDCTSDEAWEEAYGCVPLAEEGSKPCTPGYFEVFTRDPSVPHECWPLGGPTRASNSCLVGTYLPEQGCCRIPDGLPPTCALGYTFGPRVHSCVPDVYPDYCATLTFPVPACPTLPPPPPPTCYCCQFTTPNSCPQAACQWTNGACVPH